MATDRGTTYRSIGSVQASYRMPFLEALTANANLGYDLTEVSRSTFNPTALHAQLKAGTGGTLFTTNPSQLNPTLETYLNYVIIACRSARERRSDGRLFVFEVPRRVSIAQRVEPQHQPPGSQRNSSRANGSEYTEHPGKQADLVFRAAQLQPERPLPRVIERAARRVVAVRSRQRLGQLPGGCCRMARVAGTVHKQTLIGLRPEGAGVVGHHGQPAVCELPAVRCLHAGRRPVAGAVRQYVRDPPSAPPRSTRISSGNRPSPTTSASIGASTISESAAPSTGTTRARAISFSRSLSQQEAISRTS